MKQAWRSIAVLAAIMTLTVMSGCTGSKIKEGVPENAAYKPPMLQPNMGGDAKNPLEDYNKAILGKGADKKAGS